MVFRSDEYCCWLAEQRAWRVPPLDASCEYQLDLAVQSKAGGGTAAAITGKIAVSEKDTDGVPELTAAAAA